MVVPTDADRASARDRGATGAAAPGPAGDGAAGRVNPADPPVREGYLAVPGGEVWYGIVGNGPGVPLLALHGGARLPPRLPRAAGGAGRRAADRLLRSAWLRTQRPTDRSLALAGRALRRRIGSGPRQPGSGARPPVRPFLGHHPGGGLPGPPAGRSGERRAGESLPGHAPLDRGPGRLPRGAARGRAGRAQAARGGRDDRLGGLRRCLWRLLRPPPLPAAAAAGPPARVDAACQARTST